jgi:hypothetical protein
MPLTQVACSPMAAACVVPAEAGHAVRSTLKSVRFLFTAPLILALLIVINLMTWSGDWWVQWPALGLGIAWVVSLLRVGRAIVVAGGLAALAAVLANRR